LSAWRAAGGMALLTEAGGYELAQVHRFSAAWEGSASLKLRDGDISALTDYRKHGRLLDAGTPGQARSSAARAWLADTLAGRSSVLVAGSNEDAARLSAEVRAQLVELGRVADPVAALDRPDPLRPPPARSEHLPVPVPVGAEPVTAQNLLPPVEHLDGRRQLVRVDPDDHGCHAVPPRLGTQLLKARRATLLRAEQTATPTPRCPARTHAMSEPHPTSVGSRE